MSEDWKKTRVGGDDLRERAAAFETQAETDKPRFPGLRGGSSSFEAPTLDKGGRPSRAASRAAEGLMPQGRPTKQNWEILTVAELVRCRDEITAALPSLQLSKMNLEEEMLLQYHTLRELQGTVMEDDEVPVNQRAQVANTVAATLKTLGDQQIALYSSERFKQIENALIRELDKLPEDLAASFLVSYAKILSKYGK